LTGDVVNYVGIVLSGTLEIIKENPAGARYIMSFLEPSRLFGEGIVCTSKRISPVTVRVKENAQILFIPYERIIKTCENSCIYHIQLIRNTMSILGDSNMELNYKIDLLMLKGIREKLASYLLNESNNQNSLTLQIIPNRNELADYLNVSRTSMCRELGRMKELGLIDYYRNTFRIISVDNLKKCL
jgi:CRP-like cAMP-binding protein